MKKTNLYMGIAGCVVGVIIIAVGLTANSDLGGLFFGLGGGLTGASIGIIGRWRTVHGDSQSDFARHVRQTEIDQRDERNVMLRDRSAYITLNILSVLLALGWTVFEALHLLKRWTPFSSHAAVFCVGLCLLMWLCHWTVLYFLQKRM